MLSSFAQPAGCAVLNILMGLLSAKVKIPVSGCGQRRKHLDEVLFRTAANAPGVIAHTGTHVDGPLWENGRALGVYVDGQPRRAALVEPADGVHSRLHHKMGLHVPVRRKRFGICAHFRLAKGKARRLA